jgi:hypothetical protein
MLVGYRKAKIYQDWSGRREEFQFTKFDQILIFVKTILVFSCILKDDQKKNISEIFKLYFYTSKAGGFPEL